ncbi:MAG TPA: hypothetical protein VGR14_17115 [Verrucomicrobiae bacterium]|jgi:hypothetical protein|nr:hypothetical protein [Verrucomicrobiae bacterium]
MIVTAISNSENDSLIAPPNFIERAANRIVQELSADAEDWANMAGPLRMYPWTHFIENPDPEDLRKHKATLETMIAFGELLASATSSSAFPDREIAAMVAATQQMLKDDLAMWHGNQLTDAQAEKLLQKVFPE